MPFSSYFDWLEKHPVAVGLLQSAALLVVAWVSGAFAFLGRFRRRPTLKIIPTASFIFLEELGEYEGRANATRASFILNASLVNGSSEKVVLEEFILSFRTPSVFHAYKQQLVRVPFPDRPRKRVGNGRKYLSVWFTEFPASEVPNEPVYGKVEPKEYDAGYLLFVSFTWGTANPMLLDEKIKVRLTGTLTSGERLSHTCLVRVTRDKKEVDAFCPGLTGHVTHETAWVHDKRRFE